MDLILLILILIVTFTTGSLIEKAHFNKLKKKEMKKKYIYIN